LTVSVTVVFGRLFVAGGLTNLPVIALRTIFFVPTGSPPVRLRRGMDRQRKTVQF